MKRGLFFLAIIIFVFNNTNAQNRKIDTTLQYGHAGYRVTVDNKNLEKNLINIRPVGFENTARDMSFYIKGKVVKAQTDDFNNDGFPDLVIYVYSGTNGEKGTVIGVASSENKSNTGIYFPDILDDPKLRVGYKGFDEFSLMEGSLMRKFPIYSSTDTTAKAVVTGKRVIIYRVVTDPGGGMKFKAMNSYDLKE